MRRRFPFGQVTPSIAGRREGIATTLRSIGRWAVVLAVVSLESSAVPPVYVFERSAGLLEGVLESGAARQIAVAGDVGVRADGPRWALAPGDRILGHDRDATSVRLILRAGGSLVVLDERGVRTPLLEVTEANRNVLNDAVAASLDPSGRVFLLDASGALTMSERDQLTVLTHLNAVKAQDLHPDALRRDGRHVIRFQVAYRPESPLRWVTHWKRKTPSETDFLEARSPAGYSPWLAVGVRDVVPVDIIVQDLWWMRRDTVVSQKYTIGDVYPRAADERPHWDCPASRQIGPMVKGVFSAPSAPFVLERWFGDCGDRLAEGR